MKAFFDSSVLVAAFYDYHEHYEASAPLVSRQTKQTGCTATHCLAETYAILTRMPGKSRVSPDEALLYLRGLRERLTLITLDEDTYWDTLESAAEQGIAGGTIYDALLGRCATKANAETIYTWNIKHFSRLGVTARVATPAFYNA